MARDVCGLFMINRVLVVRLVAAATVLLALEAIVGSLSNSGAVTPGGVTGYSAKPAEPADRPRQMRVGDTRTLAEAIVPAAAEGATQKVLVAADAVPPALASRPAELLSAERLLIRVLGLADLTGEYRVSANYMISVPVVGRLSLEGLSASDLERELSQKLSTLTGREAYVTIEIAEYKPVFVTGAVQRPGTAPWKPGMTVLHALTIAGSSSSGDGKGPKNDSPSPLINSQLDRLRLRKVLLEQKKNLATLARLHTERSGSTVIELPESLMRIVGPKEAQDLIDEQATLMASRKQSFENQRDALDRSISSARQQLTSLERQASIVRTQLDLRKAQKEKIDGLATKGFTRSERVLDEQFRLFDLEEKQISVSVAMARVQGVISGLERDRSRLIDDRRNFLETEIFKTEREISQLEVDIELHRSAYRTATGMDLDIEEVARSGDVSRSPVSAFEYKVIRAQANGPETINANQFTRLMPGDVVVVAMQSD